MKPDDGDKKTAFPHKRKPPTINGHAYSWEPPSPLLTATAIAPFPAECFPPTLRNHALLEAKAFGVDPNIGLMSALTVAAATLDDGNQLVLDPKWKEAPRLWTVIIAGSGAGKTPVQDALLKPLEAIDDELRDYAYKQWKLATAGKKKSEWEELFPRKLRAITHDTTLEGMRDILKVSKRGVLQYAREFVSLVGSFDTYRANAAMARDRGLYIQLWNGGPLTVDRASVESVHVPNWGVSVLTAIQPDKLAKLKMNEESDGFMQRFQLVWARSRCEPEHVSISERRKAEKEYEAKLKEIHEFAPADYTLSAKAREYFDTWRRKLLAEAALFETMNPPYHGALMKMEAMALRISLILHLCQNLTAEEAKQYDHTEVLKQTMRAACRILDVHKTHAQRFFLDNDTGHRLGISSELCLYVLARLQNPADRYEIAKRDMVQHVRSFYKAGERERLAAIDMLVTGCWIQPSKLLDTTGNTTRWAINPALVKLYEPESKAEAVRRIEAKKAIDASAAIRRAEKRL